MGALTTTPVLLKPGETNITLRVLVDYSVVEAFAMKGRGSMTRRVYPKQFNESIGATLVYNVPSRDDLGEAWAAQLQPPIVTISAWKMNSGYV